MSPHEEASFTALARSIQEHFLRVGFEPLWEPIDPPSSACLHAVGLARFGSFRIFLVHCAHRPVAEAARFARQLEARSERCVVIACTGLNTGFALAAWRVGSRPVVQEVPELHPALLERLRPRRDDSGLTLHFRVIGVLEAEPVSSKFFQAFRRTLDTFARHAERDARPDDARVLALTQLTRVLFLYFVQAKGWLNGERDYLRRRLDDCLAARRSFQETFLSPLVFHALCSKQPDTTAHGQVPFLNGGLFERTRLEERVGVPSWPNHLWRQAFESLFDRFAFSVRESSTQNAVQPDMLGRVFEELMQPAQRKRSGSYYTPHDLVLQVVDVALVPLLARRASISRSRVRALLRGEHPGPAETKRLLEAVRHLTVLDPAVGSGAFLLGVLERLVTLTVTLLGPHAVTPHRLRRSILHHNLFGVDANLVAVRLAELRLWLAIIVDDPTEDPASVVPLPNLDGVVRQGDSLFDPISQLATTVGPSVMLQERARVRTARVAEARTSLFRAVGVEKRQAASKLRRAELTLARCLVTDAVEMLERDIGRLVEYGRGRDLFGEQRGLDRTTREDLKRLRGDRSRARHLRRMLKQTDEVPFFSFDLHCPEVLRDGGFDLVLGNPPWVRGERLEARTRRALTARYQSYRTVGSAGYRHAPDLAQAFVERSVELLSPGGVLAFLVPSKFATAGYAAPLRAWLRDRVALERLWRIEASASASFRAAVYPLALIASKRGAGSREPCQSSSAPWISIDDAERRLREALLASPMRLGERWRPRLGVKTGANAVFLGRVEGDAFCSLAGTTIMDCTEVLRPVVRGRDVRPFTIRPTLHILWTHETDQKPAVHLTDGLRDYFDAHRAELTSRHDYRDGPFWTLFRTAAAARRPRVVWSDIAIRLSAARLPASSAAVPMNTCYAVFPDSEDDSYALCALLNSGCIRWFARLGADEARGGYVRHNARVVGDLPLPPAQADWVSLTEYGRDAERQPVPDGEALEEIVADAFGLGRRERATLSAVSQNLR